ncbi:inactive ubiquitin carboxyl-terminal hydrolase MINDY-4B-like [Sander lucioperca]|uniref:inactive ubiquitin carboxyl-terminal hydrolase MINDY-4B-like n=1 Tax=Sander lucioperca TaxID=283035 RepID=UPI0016536C4A|nr:inactive ubiquitin carboxyl-terminal hydrolase MINDY-4B-like [Sander lucioperca]
MVVQARVLKYLLFMRQNGDEGRTLLSLRVGKKDQETALATALSDSLWLAGQQASATVTLVTEDYCVTPHLGYKLDNFTERLQLFTFSQKEDARKFILEHIHCFKDEGSHGVILFLYSLVCSRTVDRLEEDLDCSTSHLLYRKLGTFVCRQTLLNLLLTGRASPNVFNGTLLFGEDGRPLQHPLQGIASRCDVGYLHWSREEMERGRLLQVGSMLKTPVFPVWLCCINSSYSVVFGLNRSLLSDWKMEHLFHLYYYSGQSSQTTTARLTVDTHSHHWEAPADGDPEKRFPSLEMTIRTKWAGAAVDWSGHAPFY